MRLKVKHAIADKIKRTPKDFRVDTFRAGGKGGQNQNKVESGVRITDLVTGLSAEGREFRDQPQNRKAAMERLVLKLVKHYQIEELSTLVKKEEIGVVRTYKEPKGAVIDHRLGKKVYNYDNVLDGKGLGEIIADLKTNEANLTNP